MFKAITQRFALILALTLFTLPASRMHAQSAAPTPSVVTGGDPQPTGEPDPPPKPKTNAMPVLVLTTLVALGLA